MMWLLVFAAAAYGGYRWNGWPGAALGALVAAGLWLAARLLRARADRAAAEALARTRLSEAEKAHARAVAEHQAAMDAHRAQFDPELRRKRASPSGD
jgi:hypothetical protein